MGATDIAQVGTHGRMRQHIVAVGGIQQASRGEIPVTKDPFLRVLVRRGVVTRKRLEQAVQGYNKMPAKYGWIVGVKQPMLDRADCAFLAEFGRFPTEDADFEMNGTYHRVCRGLDYDWHYYDKHLAKLRWDDQGNPYVRPLDETRAVGEVREFEVKRGNGWAFALVLAAGLVGGPVIAAAIARNVSQDGLSAAFVFGIVWVLCFAGLLALTLPRRQMRKRTLHKCGRCGRELVSGRSVFGCPICGLLFDESPAAEAAPGQTPAPKPAALTS
jgi:hypothetical protein